MSSPSGWGPFGGSGSRGSTALRWYKLTGFIIVTNCKEAGPILRKQLKVARMGGVCFLHMLFQWFFGNPEAVLVGDLEGRCTLIPVNYLACEDSKNKGMLSLLKKVPKLEKFIYLKDLLRVVERADRFERLMQQWNWVIPETHLVEIGIMLVGLGEETPEGEFMAICSLFSQPRCGIQKRC